LFYIFAGKKCKRNERYKYKTIACPNNCVERRASRSCRVPKIEDCECKRGYVKSGDECVKYKRRKYPNCGCKKNGRYIKVILKKYFTIADFYTHKYILYWTRTEPRRLV
jgi:hypothetical protein